MYIKDNRVCYIYQLNDGDLGPLQHVNAIIKYSNIHLTISNCSFGHPKEHYQLKNYSTKLINNIFFQFKICIYLLKKSKNYDIVLQRLSIGSFLPTVLCSIIGKPFISELNGDFRQDLIDRGHSYILIYQKILYSLNFNLSYYIYLVHGNLRNLVSTYSSSIKALHSTFVIKNGYEPVKYSKMFKSNKKINLGYLGSLNKREGVDLFLNILMNNSEKLHGFIVGGTYDELKKISGSRSIVNLNYFENCPREDALSILSQCDYLVFLRRKLTTCNTIDSQGCPLKLLDYIFLQKPIILSNLKNHQYYFNSYIGLSVEDFVNDYINDKNKIFPYNKEFAQKLCDNSTWESRIKTLNTYINYVYN